MGSRSFLPTDTLGVVEEREGPGLVWGGGALTIAGVLTTIIAPLLVDALGSAGLSTPEVGSHLTALHLVQVVVIFGLGGTGLVGRFDRRLAGMLGCAMSAAALVACALTTSGTWLMVLLLVVGAGAGLAYSAGASALSYVEDTERAYALVTIASIVIGAIVLAGTALVPLEYSQVGIFLGLAAVLLLLGAVGLRIPALAPAHTSSGGPVGSAGWLGTSGAALIAGYFLLNVGILAVWTYSGSIAQAAGMTSAESWWFLGLSQVLSVIGCLIAWRMGPHPGKIWVLVVSLLGIMVGKLMIGTAILVPYAVGILLTNLTFYTAIPFIFAAAADLNPRSGRLVVIVGGSAMAAGAVAPVFGGWAAGDSEDWLRLGIAAALVILVSIPLLMFAERVAYRRKHPASSGTVVTAPGR